MDAIHAEIGERVRLGRKRLKLSQCEFALRMGLSRTSISNIESGRQMLTVENILKLTKMFSCSADEILGISKPVISEVRTELTGLRARIQRIVQICEEA